jgi:hypothetical protein
MMNDFEFSGSKDLKIALNMTSVDHTFPEHSNIEELQ